MSLPPSKEIMVNHPLLFFSSTDYINVSYLEMIISSSFLINIQYFSVITNLSS